MKNMQMELFLKKHTLNTHLLAHLDQDKQKQPAK